MSPDQENNVTGDIAIKELLAAKDAIVSFNSAFKYYSLYPEGHAYSQNYLEKLKTDLDNFLHEYKKLRIDISKNGFDYRGEPVFAGHAEENNTAYLLTRDRILFIEFSEHIELNEITVLFDIFNKHKNPLEETDGDIATTLWHHKFQHIHYEAADIFAMEAIDFDLSMFKAAPVAGEPHPTDDENTERGNGSSGRGHGEGSSWAQGTGHSFSTASHNIHGVTSTSMDGQQEAIPKSLLTLAKESDLSVLTAEEKNTLQSYIREEEIKNNAQDVIDILLIVLSIESNEIDFATVLEFLEFEFFEAMVQEDYFLAHKICKNVDSISRAIGPKKPWAVSLIYLFFENLSQESRFEELPCVTNYNNIVSEPEKYTLLWSIFEQLSAEIMFPLSSLASMTPIDNLHLRNKLVELISTKSKQNPSVFARLLAESSEETNLLLFPVIQELNAKNANRMYLQMTRHSAPNVRKIGIDGYFQTQQDTSPDELHHLLRDDNEQLRERILSYLAQADDKMTEQLLLAYLRTDGKTTENEGHIIQCYKLLSQRLSPESIGFLRETLLESKLTSMISTIEKTHKIGAACALKTHGTKEGKEILHKGAESMRPDVRNACRKVLEH